MITCATTCKCKTFQFVLFALFFYHSNENHCSCVLAYTIILWTRFYVGCVLGSSNTYKIDAHQRIHAAAADKGRSEMEWIETYSVYTLFSCITSKMGIFRRMAVPPDVLTTAHKNISVWCARAHARKLAHLIPIGKLYVCVLGCRDCCVHLDKQNPLIVRCFCTHNETLLIARTVSSTATFSRC